jgi:hypothetical protein
VWHSIFIYVFQVNRCPACHHTKTAVQHHQLLQLIPCCKGRNPHQLLLLLLLLGCTAATAAAAAVHCCRCWQGLCCFDDTHRELFEVWGKASQEALWGLEQV